MLDAARRYTEKFAELVAAGTPATGLQSQEALLLHSWQQFLKRWLAAARAAAKAEVRRVKFPRAQAQHVVKVGSHRYGKGSQDSSEVSQPRG